MISIILPTVDANEITRDCIDSILECTASPYEIVLIDNGSRVPFVPANGADKINLIRFEKNIGYPAAMNAGMRAAKGDHLCLTNNDTIMTPDYDVKLLKHLENYDVIGASGCNITAAQCATIPYYESKEELYAVATEWARERAGKASPHWRVIPLCMVMSRETQARAGFYDEIFTPGNFEDDDYSLRLISMGFRIGYAHDVYIHHIGGEYFKRDMESYVALLKRNRAIFEGKWPEAERERLKKLAMKGHE